MRSLILGLSIFILPVQALAQDTPQAKDTEPKTVQELLNQTGIDIANLGFRKEKNYPDKNKLCADIRNTILTEDINFIEPSYKSDNYEDIKKHIGNCPLNMFEFVPADTTKYSTRYPAGDYQLFKLPNKDNFILYIGRYIVNGKLSVPEDGRFYYNLAEDCRVVKSDQIYSKSKPHFFLHKDDLYGVYANSWAASFKLLTSKKYLLCSYSPKYFKK